ncbi:DNA-directed DNA polymerase [Powellomyces hirtus]|uniref:DNA-directed DNA polymerase n=1 Tax=Powellomyces hirtus TaxID=109895 RepID=A0A507DTC0_9FUNG|nr:DNA-directed DNA polymerase [Powellomyces hirtus]
MDQVRAILHDSRAPFKLWGELAMAVNYLRQRTPSTSLNGETPYQRWFGTPADVSNLRTIWSEAYMHQPVHRRTHRKLGARAVGPFRLVGYHPTKQGNYRLYDASTDSIIDARDVTINEADYISPVAQSDTTPEYVVERILLSRNGEGGEEFLVKWLGYDEPTWEPLDNVKDSEALTRFTGIEDDGTPVIAELHAACSTDIDEPVTYQEAVNSPYAKEWKQAIDAELSSHRTNKTWDTDTMQTPPGTHLVDSKWVFKVKRNADGSIKKFKARLVARGFTQREGIDFNETYAPVVKFNTLRALLALAAKLDLHVHQMDVITAFLNGDLDVEIWMRLPAGVADNVVKLRRSLYGLKQSPHLWNKVLDSFLQQLGFSVSEFDTALYIKRTDNTKILIVAVYVDDLTIFASDLDDLLALKSALAERFKMEDMGEISFLLGLQITRDRSKRCITIGQQKYIKDMIDKFNLNGMRPHHIPMDPNLHLNANDGADALDASGIKDYQDSPHLAYSISRLSQFLATPTVAHMTAAKKVCAYANTTSGLSLVFKDGGDIVGYSDADYARCTDTRRSTSGYVFMLNGAAISWKSQRQKSTALSTAEAEYIALAECAKEALWIQGLLSELSATEQTAVPIYEDNQAAIKLAANPTHHQRTKHIDVRYHFLRDLVGNERIHLQYIESKLMLADALTKPLPRPLLDDLRHRTGLRTKSDYAKFH